MPTRKSSKKNGNQKKAGSPTKTASGHADHGMTTTPVPGSDPTPSTTGLFGGGHDAGDQNTEDGRHHDHGDPHQTGSHDDQNDHEHGMYQPALAQQSVNEVPYDRPSHDAVWKDSDGAMPVMKMTQACYENVMKDLARRPFTREMGGMLIGPDDSNDIVTHYVKDEFGHSTTASFTIDHETLNRAINRVRPAKMICVGLVHSHPNGICRPSGGDIAFLKRLFDSPRNHQGSPGFLFPIVCQQKLHPYIVDARNPGRILPAQLVLI